MSRGLGARSVAFILAAATALALATNASASTIDSSGLAAPAGLSPQSVPLLPLSRIGDNTVTSSNWSGYAVQDAGQFTDVTGTWVEPAATCKSFFFSQYAAFWAGIDGYASNSVEQLGTEANCRGRNRPSYYAWYELFPATSIPLSTSLYPVQPGDTMTAEVSVSGSTFTLTLKSSEGWTFTTTQTGSGLAQSSAELIAEAPQLCGIFFCHQAQLSNFGTVNFTGAQAAVNGGSDQPFSSFTTDSGPHEIIAELSNGTVEAQPSPLSTAGTAFSITWEHA
jgi:hypothetical protein